MTFTLDDDGYPTDDALVSIQQWRGDPRELLAAIRPIWRYADAGYWTEQFGVDRLRRKRVRRYSISTGGWSGNEDLIHALQANPVFWLMYWVQSQRGGHYIFEVPKQTKGAA